MFIKCSAICSDNLPAKNVAFNAAKLLPSRLNKSNINFRLSGNNKYYYANQCQEFYGNLKKYLEKSNHDFDKRQLERLKKEGICFNKYSINIGYNQYCEDYKRFNSTQELLGFVIGFNQAMNSWSN